MKYISTKFIEAEPRLAQKDIGDHKKGDPGYRIHYPDGYVSWCPKKEFEEHYLPYLPNTGSEETGPCISEAMVNDFIVSTGQITFGEKCTVVRAILRNGFEIVESSTCVSPENYSAEVGYALCMEKIRDKVWEFLGFLLATALNGVDGR